MKFSRAFLLIAILSLNVGCGGGSAGSAAPASTTLGEYAAMLRTNLTGDALALHKKSRIYYINYVTKSAVANGVLPFYWDVGGLIDRGSNNAVLDPDLLDALVKGATP